MHKNNPTATSIVRPEPDGSMAAHEKASDAEGGPTDNEPPASHRGILFSPVNQIAHVPHTAPEVESDRGQRKTIARD
jgi:hypothetical protein